MENRTNSEGGFFGGEPKAAKLDYIPRGLESAAVCGTPRPLPWFRPGRQARNKTWHRRPQFRSGQL